MNADVFINILYPVLPELSIQKGGKIPLDLHLYGPLTNTAQNLQRKIVKGENYKNWRLNGELIYSPTDDPRRYDALVPNDLLVLEFFGTDIPVSAKLVFLSSEDPGDRLLSDLLNRRIESKSMITISEDELEQDVTEALISREHPIYQLIGDEELDTAVITGDLDLKTILAKPNLKRISKEDFLNARSRADECGESGEEFVNFYLQKQLSTGDILEYKWISKENPLYPYDFWVKELNGNEVFVDVKSTRGSFDSNIFISNNELVQMLAADRYDIYRIYEMTQSTANVRIAKNVQQFAREILDVFRNLPSGVLANGIAASPAKMPFDLNPEYLEY